MLPSITGTRKFKRGVTRVSQSGADWLYLQEPVQFLAYFFD